MPVSVKGRLGGLFSFHVGRLGSFSFLLLACTAYYLAYVDTIKAVLIRLSIPMVKLLATLALVITFSAVDMLALAADTLSSHQQRSRAMELYIDGSSLQNLEGNHAEAIKKFEAALSYDPSPEILTAAARSYFELGDNRRCIEYLSNALVMDSTYVPAWELKAEYLVNMGSYDDAIVAYEHAASRNPTLRQLYTLGRLYEPRDARKAIGVFERIIERNSDQDVLFHLVDLYKRVKYDSLRLFTLQRIYDMDPYEPDISSELLSGYILRHSYIPAARILKMWNSNGSIVATQQQYWTALTTILADTADITLWRDSVIYLTSRVDTASYTNWKIAVLQGAVYLRVGDSILADRVFDMLQQPDYPYADAQMYYGIASSYMNAGRFPMAIRAIDHGLTSHPFNTPLHMLKASCHAELGQPDEATGEIRSVIASEPLNVDALLQIAILYDNAFNTDSSEFFYERVLAIDNVNALAANNLAYSFSNRSIHLERARILSRIALEQYPGNTSYLDTYAWILYKLGDHRKALTVIEKAVANGGKAIHYEHLGDILFALNETTAAVEAWREAIARGGTTESIEEKIRQAQTN